jgi:hypothetical protein
MSGTKPNPNLAMQNEITFPDQFNGYTRIEYMSVFISFLYALVISEFFLGWTRMVRNRSTLVFSLDHLMYSGLFFWILLLNWWSLWVRMEFLASGFLYFVLIIIPLALSYFVTVLMFPNLDQETDLPNYFDRNFKIIGVGLALFIMVNLLVGMLMGETVGTMVTLFRFGNSLFIFVVAFFNLRKLRRAFAVIMAIALLIGSIQIAFI